MSSKKVKIKFKSVYLFNENKYLHIHKQRLVIKRLSWKKGCWNMEEVFSFTLKTKNMFVSDY